ncbi:MAG: hypothetical protein IJB52_11690 [Clostridia bacterium]|nr:hypothetical protein [Clostridia bacterium]
MIEQDLMDRITEAYGCAVDPGMYERIGVWEDWWRGEVDGFHTYLENAAFGHPVRRKLYGMRMAKKVCEDWAALLLNDKTYVRLGDTAAEDWVGKVFRDGDFWRRSNYLVEKTFAAGTGACLLRVDGISRTEWMEERRRQNAWPAQETEPAEERQEEDREGTALLRELLPDGICGGGYGRNIHGWSEEGHPVRIWFDFVDASQIVPVSVEGGRITEAAFVSRITLRGKDYDYLEVHLRQADGYTIHNRYFCRENGKLMEVHLPDMPAREIRTGCPYPFFAILTPNIQNTADGAGGMGQSIYGDALDCLRGVDLAFNNFCRDLRLGGKKVFINQSLIQRDDAGNLYSPDDVAQQLFMTIGDTDLADNPLIEEHNPSLRTRENSDAVQCQLDYLAFRCGLGTRHYLFTGVQGKAHLTATQYTGERQDMRQNCAKHSQNVTAYLCGVIRPMLWLAVHMLGKGFFASDIRISFDDSYFIDSESERARDLREVEAGLMDPEQFRRRWYRDDR